MHPDLSPHLHSEECNLVISLLKECHKEVRVLKSKTSCVWELGVSILARILFHQKVTSPLQAEQP